MDRQVDRILTRRRTLKRLAHIGVGTATGLIVATRPYERPTLKKMLQPLDRAAAQTSSCPDEDDEGCNTPP
ncbi:MAG: hypothetical protein KME17_03640 [Cyanosarcina radialis HA8281-LM2]|jgi:hypothetical protein|nr:hypothetical protein [Cyanosarcina radialis HA8281-LM2]